MKGIAGAGTLAQARPRLYVPRLHSFVECEAAWNIDPLGGVIGVED